MQCSLVKNYTEWGSVRTKQGGKMTIGELKKHFHKFDDGHIFTFALSDPFSWRGIYAEVAFDIEAKPSTKKDNLSKIESALNDTFVGYKGGEFKYDEETPVNFEEGRSRYTDGRYADALLLEIRGYEHHDREATLTEAAFK